MNYELIAKYMIDRARNETMSGHQIVISTEDIEKEFGVEIDEMDKLIIERELFNFEEVADLECYDGEFDLFLYLEYDEDEED